jgi:hypothetical protein
MLNGAFLKDGAKQFAGGTPWCPEIHNDWHDYLGYELTKVCCSGIDWQRKQILLTRTANRRLIKLINGNTISFGTLRTMNNHLISLIS